MHTTNDEENSDDVDDVIDVDDDDDDDEVDDEDKDVEEWGGRWRECDAYTPELFDYVLKILLTNRSIASMLLR